MVHFDELSPEEKAKPYSKYFREPAAPPPELAAILADPRPMDPAKALPLQRINDLLDPGYHEVETGHCVMPDGSGYVAALNRMPGVTVDMVRWWMAWFVLEDLRYKIWSPYDHKGVKIREEDRAILLDPGIPRERKIQNPSPWHLAIEDIGFGVTEVHINLLGPEDQGFDMSRFHPPNVGTTVGGVPLVMVEGGSPLPVTMVHFIREIPGGVEYRTRFWMGWKIVDKKPVLALPPGASISEAATAALLSHDIREYSNLRVLLPDMYREQGGMIP